MADELEGTVPESGDTGDTGDIQPDPVEAEARAKGWKPKEEYAGDVEEFQSAKRFLKNKELYDRVKKVDHLEKRLREADSTLNKVLSHQQVIIQGAVEQAISNLKAQRKDAITEGDADRVEALDTEIERQRAIQVSAPRADGLHPDVKAWLGEPENKWFHDDEELRDFAVFKNERYLKEHPGEFAASLEFVDKEVKKAFPDKFANPRRKEPPAVEGGGRKAQGTSHKYSISRLSPDQRLICEQYVRGGIMSQDSYIKSLEEAGALE